MKTNGEAEQGEIQSGQGASGCAGIVLGVILLLLLLFVFVLMSFRNMGDPMPSGTAQVYPTIPPGVEAAFVFSFVKVQVCDGDPYSQLRASFQITNTGTYTFSIAMKSVVDLDTGENLFGGVPPGYPSIGFSTGPDICRASQMPELGPGAIGYLQTNLPDNARGHRARADFTLDGRGLSSRSTLDFVIP